MYVYNNSTRYLLYLGCIRLICIRWILKKIVSIDIHILIRYQSIFFCENRFKCSSYFRWNTRKPKIGNRVGKNILFNRRFYEEVVDGLGAVVGC